jgi:hypothetical protein
MADAPAHGKRYCGHSNHEPESPKLRPLMEQAAKMGITIIGFDLNGGATLAFAECKKDYDAAGGKQFLIERFAVQELARPAPAGSSEAAYAAAESTIGSDRVELRRAAFAGSDVRMQRASAAGCEVC